jgi:hypothetical protein
MRQHGAFCGEGRRGGKTLRHDDPVAADDFLAFGEGAIRANAFAAHECCVHGEARTRLEAALFEVRLIPSVKLVDGRLDVGFGGRLVPLAARE